jgi:hypothetical protein
MMPKCSRFETSPGETGDSIATTMPMMHFRKYAMTRTLFSFLLLLGLGGCGHLATKPPSAANANPESQIVEVKTLAAIPEALAEGGTRKTLLVLDIDDTLLTSSGFFGSDRWYEWQKSLADGDPGKVPCKFDVIALNYEAGTQVATEPGDGPRIVNALGTDTLILTARNPLYRSGTIRELKRAGYTLPRNLDGSSDGRIYRWRRDPAAVPTMISYDSGVLMVSGQDKGVMLLDLLQRLNLRYDRVVLVDDGKKNIDAMQAALGDAGIDYQGLHYTRVDKAIRDADRNAGVAGWQAMRSLLQSVFPERLADFEAGHCAF